MASFEVGPFEPAFSIEFDPEFPGDGEWDWPVIGFDRNGRAMAEFDSRWGTPVVLSIIPASGEAWIAMFAAGGLGGVRGAAAMPSPEQLAVAVDGLVYLVDVESPGQPALAVYDAIRQLAFCPNPPMLLLVGFTDMVAWGPEGVAWATSRLCVDDLQVEGVSATAIVCSCDNLGGTPTITLDPRSGNQTDGTRLDSFWPRDALA
jgi:hypothetical protein